MSVSLLSEPEVQALIRDLDLVPSSSPEAKSAYDWRIAVVHRFYQLRSFYRNCVPLKAYDDPLPLDLLYHRFNSKGKKRKVGCSFDCQLVFRF